MVGIQYDLTGSEAIFQGADWYKDFNLVNPDTEAPYDLSGLSVRSSARKKHTDALPAWDFVCSVHNIATATIRLALPNAQSSQVKMGLYKYDVELFSTNDAVVYRVITPSYVEVVEEYTK